MKRKLFAFKKIERGTATIEIAVIVPAVAMFIVLCLQITHAFRTAELNLLSATRSAKGAIYGWQEQNASDGFALPCIELIEPSTYGEVGRELAIGFKAFSWRGMLRQEVKIAKDDICGAR